MQNSFLIHDSDAFTGSSRSFYSDSKYGLLLQIHISASYQLNLDSTEAPSEDNVPEKL